MYKGSKKFYNRFSFLYPFIDWFLKSQKQKLVEEVNCCAAGNLLEIGVGNGTHLPLYKNHRITGIDISRAMLHHAEKFKNNNIVLLEMDGENLLFEADRFDYVVLSHVIAVAGDPDKMLDEVYRVLKPGGKVFILNHFTPSNWLRFIDRAFNIFSGLFHFRSLFHTDSVKTLGKFLMIREMELGKLSYFKILILSKL